jgi:SAM-dependent methyltransferase
MPAGEPIVNVDEVMREIRARVCPADAIPPPLLQTDGSKAPDFTRLQACSAEIREALDALRRPPPSPPTLRGRTGAFLLRLVSRALFWHTAQVAAVAAAAARAIGSHGEALESLGRAAARATRATVSLGEALDRLERNQDAIRAELEELNRRAAAEQAAREEFQPRSGPRPRPSTRPAPLHQAPNGRRAHPLEARRARVSGRRDRLAFDTFYCSLLDHFRGSPAEIDQRLRVYLPYLRSTPDAASAPVLDVGCGRGEWLELLRREGVQARGVDRSPAMAARCRELGLQVVEADGIRYLRSLPDASLGTLTALHVVEHLALPRLLQFLDESVRVLRPGGLLILETPNPQNILVGCHNFYLDPTHLSPLPAPLLRFLAESRGFCQAELLFLNPYADSYRLGPQGQDTAEKFNEYFYGAQDYAVLARKA